MTCPLCHDSGYVSYRGSDGLEHLAPCTCPIGNAIYWEQRRKAAEAEKRENLNLSNSRGLEGEAGDDD
jgi:hypothetical protein